MITRRGIIAGLIAAPAIVKFSSLMPVRGYVDELIREPRIVHGPWQIPHGPIRFTLEEFSPENVRLMLLGSDEDWS